MKYSLSFDTSTLLLIDKSTIMKSTKTDIHIKVLGVYYSNQSSHYYIILISRAINVFVYHDCAAKLSNQLVI